MTQRKTPPFRADHVGSLLRPAELHEARDKARRGEMSAEALRALQDKHIRDAVPHAPKGRYCSPTAFRLRQEYVPLPPTSEVG